MAENAADDPVVETVQLTKIYQNRHIALNDVTLKLERGCVLGLLGANGAGKTTLLRLIIGLHRPTAGVAKVFGEVMTPNSAELRRRIGYIPTNPRFPKGMTPISYLDYMAKLFGLPRDVRKPRMGMLLRAVDLLGAGGTQIDTFSNGMTARLAVATSLINDPDLLIWDEPTHGLDPEARRSMLDLIKGLSREKTLIVSSHNLNDIDEVCNHAAVLSHGQLIYSGPLHDLKSRMRRNHFEVDVDGDQKAVTRALATIKTLGDVQHVSLEHRRLNLRLQEDAVATATLGQVFQVLSEAKLTLIGIRSVGQQTEEAFLDLVEKEEQRGFTRIYRQAA